jgi:glycosyltransferase involved in cell wall biosynthesis
VRRLEEASRGLGDRVRRLGRLADVRELLDACDVFALASRTEEAPMSVLEAMAAGLPVVATDVGGVGELVAAGETGLLSPAGDVPALSANIERLGLDAGLRRRLGAAGRARVLAEFTAGAVVGRIEAVLRDAAALRPEWARRRLERAPAA